MRVGSKHPDSKLGLDRSAAGRLRRFAGWVTVVVFIFPLAYLLWGSMTINGGFLAGTSVDTITAPLARSLLLASAAAVVGTVLGTSMAWLVTRTDLPGKRIWQAVVALPLVIPSYVGAAGLRAAFGQGGLIPWVPRPTGFWGSLLVLSALTYPYVYLPVAARLGGMASSLEDAARLLGDQGSKVLRRIVLPQIQPAMLAGGLIVFLYALSDFGAVSLMRYDTITRAIFASRLADKGTALTLGLMLAIVAIGVALVERRLSSRGDHVVIEGGRPRMYELGPLRRWAAGAVGAVVAMALLAPISVFVVWWVRGSLALGMGYSGLGESLSLLVAPARNSAIAGVVAGGAAMVVLLPAAYLTARRATVVGAVSNIVIAAAFALPGLVIALAVVYWILQAPEAIAGLYQGFPLLVLVYVVHFGVQSHRASVGAVAALPARYGEAARVLGAGSTRRFFTVDLPLIGPGVLAGGGLVMLSTLKELPATLLLAPIGFDTLATRVWGASEDGFLSEVGVTSLTLILLSGFLTWLLVLRPTKATALQ
ncbi:MAG: iron ABC transporter permease [Actinomycetota bacterium]|nr:iron ABC transporter permease [Actinomycetota bacterium]